MRKKKPSRTGGQAEERADGQRDTRVYIVVLLRKNEATKRPLTLFAQANAEEILAIRVNPLSVDMQPHSARVRRDVYD